MCPAKCAAFCPSTLSTSAATAATASWPCVTAARKLTKPKVSLFVCRLCMCLSSLFADRQHQRVPVLRAGHIIGKVLEKEKKYYCEQLAEFCDLESTAIPASAAATAESKREPENVRAWTAAQLRKFVCSLKPHFAPLFELELKDADGASFLGLSTPECRAGWMCDRGVNGWPSLLRTSPFDSGCSMIHTKVPWLSTNHLL